MKTRWREPQLKKLAHLCNSVGWAIHVPTDAGMQGAIIGTHDFIEAVRELIGEGKPEKEVLENEQV